jgi:hypothetical protein
VRPKEFQVGDLVCVFLDLDLESVDLPAATVAMLISLPRSTMMDFFVDGRITTVASMGMGMRYEILRPPPPTPHTHNVFFYSFRGVRVVGLINRCEVCFTKEIALIFLHKIVRKSFFGTDFNHCPPINYNPYYVLLF